MARLLDRVALLITAVLVVVGLWNAPWDSMRHFAGRYVRVLGDKLDPKAPPGFPCRDTDGLIATMDSVAQEILRELHAHDNERRARLATPTNQSPATPTNQSSDSDEWKYYQRTLPLREAYWSLRCTRIWRPKEW
jgi:hypothetical protein